MEHHIWTYSAIIIFLVVLSKILSAKTATVDVLWLILFGAIGVNFSILPEHNEVLEMIGEWGIVFIMFALGFDEDLNHFLKGIKRSFGVATLGAIFPFLAGFYTAGFFGYDFNSQIIWGLTMTATAVSLTMVSLREQNLHKTTASTAIMSAAVVDDILSLVGLAIMIPIALNTSSDMSINVDAGSIFLILLKVVIFFIIIGFIGMVLFPESLKKEKDVKHGIIFKIVVQTRKYMGIRQLLTAYSGKFTPLVMIFTAFTFGAIAHYFGFHPAIGAYFAGLFLKEEYFSIIVDNEIKSHKEDGEFVINHLAYTIFGPIFFVMLGTKLIFDYEILIRVLPAIFTLFLAVLVVQVIAALLAARFTGRYKWHESVMIGLGMLGRAELAFIVINIAFVENKIINIEQFYTLIFTLFLLNLTVPTVIKWWKPYYNGDKTLHVFGVKLSK